MKKLKKNDPILVLDEFEPPIEQSNRLPQPTEKNPFELLSQQLKPEHFESLENIYDKYTAYHYRHLKEVSKQDCLLQVVLYTFLSFFIGKFIQGHGLFQSVRSAYFILFVSGFYLGFMTLFSKVLTGRTNAKYLTYYLLMGLNVNCLLRIIKPYFLMIPNIDSQVEMIYNLLNVGILYYFFGKIDQTFVKMNALEKFRKYKIAGVALLLILLFMDPGIRVKLFAKDATIVYADHGSDDAKPVQELDNTIDSLLSKLP